MDHINLLLPKLTTTGIGSRKTRKLLYGCITTDGSSESMVIVFHLCMNQKKFTKNGHMKVYDGRTASLEILL